MDSEPMDVDKSASSTSKMDISFNDTDSDIYVDSRQEVQTTKDSPKVEPTIPKSCVKTYHIKMQSKKKESPSTLKYLISGISVLIVSIITYQVINFKCADEIDLRLLRKSFSENLFGQGAAGNKIIDTLSVEDKSKIIFLYGGTGVGKTYAVSLMLDKLWNSGNVYHYTMPTFADTFSTELMLGLTVCETSIVVVDDLTRNDMHITSQITNLIAKSETLGKNITIILVYNCDDITDNFVKKCDISFEKQLEKSFAHIDVAKYFVKFQQLEQDHLKKCIEKELGDRKVNAEDMKNIMKNFDVTLDGCKGVYMKIKFLNVI